jgi:cytochrome c peroxidase
MEESASENAVKKLVAVFSGILLAGAIVLFVVYHIVNVLPPEGTSYNIQATAIFEDAACEKCHRSNNDMFDIQETMAKLKKDTVIGEVSLAKIEYATVINPTMPPKTYYLTHWGAAINSSKKKLLEEWVNHQRSNYYLAPKSPKGDVSELFRNEPLRPVQKPEKTDNKKTELGRKLFFDVRLSADNSVSCNTCHRLETGGMDNRQYSQGAGKTLSKINTPTVFNACFHLRLFWDGRASDLYAQLREHLTDHSTMGNHSLKAIIEKLNEDENLKDRFLKIYRAGITPTTLIETVVEFEKTLVTSDSRFDKYLQGSLQTLNEA